MKARKAVLFLKKKNQKDFFYSGSGALAGSAAMARHKKFFCFFLFTERSSSLALAGL